jgi:MoaA/NifB/PqqE/SkfB family radical SAM enzyme
MAELRFAYKRAYEAVNYRLRTFAGGRFSSHCRPTSIAILLTELCNARCTHCDIWKNRGKEDSPSADQWKAVLADLRKWLGPVQVFFTGGEALLKPFTIELVEYGSSIGLFVELLTHGYWIDQGKIERLALANPWRVTISLDGIGEAHNRVRGREGFFDKTGATIETLDRVRREKGLRLALRLKTVVMEHNLDDLAKVARFASRPGMDVFYQPIEQNYNTAEDVRWFEHSPNWPKDVERAIRAVEELIRLKKEGLHIANSFAQLEAMIPYFRDPDSMRIATQSHSAHERGASCAALTTLQIQANGDVTNCTGQQPVGNVKLAPVREIWEGRPRWWEFGCCLERRCSEAEKRVLSLPIISLAE